MCEGGALGAHSLLDSVEGPCRDIKRAESAESAEPEAEKVLLHLGSSYMSAWKSTKAGNLAAVRLVASGDRRPHKLPRAGKNTRTYAPNAQTQQHVC